jgi:hypothetical protein
LFYSNFSSSSFVHNGECPYAKWYGNDMNYSLKNINEYAFYRNIKTIVNEAKCERTPVILFSEWGNPEFFEKLIKCETGLYQYNEDVLKKISEEESVYFIPFPKNKIPQATWSDDIHVNEIGEKILGNYVGQFIEERFFLSYK